MDVSPLIIFFVIATSYGNHLMSFDFSNSLRPPLGAYYTQCISGPLMYNGMDDAIDLAVR